MLTQERLKEVLDYNPISGAWTWLYRPSATPQWNGRFAGKPAGGIDPDTEYLRIRIDDVLYYAHRLAFLYMTGSWPQNESDHENLNRADCRWENLRDSTHVQNNCNKIKRSDNTSGFKGVWRNKSSWVAEATVNGVRYRKWGFKSPEEAHAAYDAIVREHAGEFARSA